jgi:hypothetical protein
MEDRAELIKQRWREDLRENAGDRLFLRVEELGNSVNDAVLRAQAMLGRPVVQFGSTVDKLVFTTGVLSRLAGRILFVTILAMGGVTASWSLYGTPLTLGSFSSVLLAVIQNPFYLVAIGLMAALNLRHIFFRLQERDDEDRRRRRRN